MWHRKRDFYGFGGWRFVVDMRKTEASHGDIRSSAMRERSVEVSRGQPRLRCGVGDIYVWSPEMRPHRRNTGQRVSLRSTVEIGKALLARARDFADGWRPPAADAVVEVFQRVTHSILTPVVADDSTVHDCSITRWSGPRRRERPLGAGQGARP